MSEPMEEIRLTTLITGILQALRHAQHAGNLETDALVGTYRKEKSLGSLPVPAFGIADVEVEFRFSVVGTAEEPKKEGVAPDLNVNISPTSLKALEAHQVNVMRVRINPITLRVFEETK